MALLLLLVGLYLKLGEHQLEMSTYSGISLVSWLEWKGKTVRTFTWDKTSEDKDMWGQASGQDKQLEDWSDHRWTKRGQHKDTHTHLYWNTVSVGLNWWLRVILWTCPFASTPLFTLDSKSIVFMCNSIQTSVFVKGTINKIHRAVKSWLISLATG